MLLEDDLDRSGAAVLADVGQRLLDDPVEVQRRRRRHQRRPTGQDRKVRIDPRPLLEAADEHPEGVHEAFLDAGPSAQLVKQLAKAVEHTSGGVLEDVHLPEHPLAADLLGLEVLKIDQHRRERLGDPIVQLSSEQPPNVFIRQRRAAARLRP